MPVGTAYVFSCCLREMICAHRAACSSSKSPKQRGAASRQQGEPGAFLQQRCLISFTILFRKNGRFKVILGPPPPVAASSRASVGLIQDDDDSGRSPFPVDASCW